MRIRAVVAIGLLLIPAALEAQRRLRLPRIGRRPAPPTSIPQQPPVVANAMAYRRLNVSVESYPMINRIETPGIVAGAPALISTTFGAGERLDYRLTRHLSATLDLTSTLFGGTSSTASAELGARLRPPRSERRWYPFLDVRGGYLALYQSSFGTVDFADPFTGPVAYGSRYSRGFGGVGGAGIEMAISRSLSVTTMASVMRSRMTTIGFDGARPADRSRFGLTAYRYTLGLRWNPVRLVTSAINDPTAR